MATELFCISVYYTDLDGEKKTRRLINNDKKFLKEFREAVFAVGLAIPDEGDPGRFLVLPPWSIQFIDVQKQDKFFKE